ncbi:MAG: system Cascade subunit CasA [Pseudomonadota bacterium]|nr:system Cascade subunit CasA [Pseudomonadota bacterium]
MDLLTSAWIPVRADRGAGAFCLLTYEELLCHGGTWVISLPRDDLELAGLQLLVCMTQVLFLPTEDAALRQRFNQPLSPEAFADGVRPVVNWFQLDHPTQPFMQTRGIKAKDRTPIQKLLIGLPDGNNHAFFNEVGEVQRLGAPAAAIALFNQAANSPSFGGGFKGGLRGGSPVTTLVAGHDLRETVWRNVLTLPRVRQRLPQYEPDWTRDVPTWIKPIREQEVIQSATIGLARGLFWQPAHVDLIAADAEAPCDLIDGAPGRVYAGFNKEKFVFTVEGVWPHPHGALKTDVKKGVIEQKFVSFTTTAPAWTHLSEWVVPRTVDAADSQVGCSPAGPVVQAGELGRGRSEPLRLLIGGYRTNKASVLQRRHELMSLATGWQDDKERLRQLVDLGKAAKTALRGALYYAAQGASDRGLPGIGAAIHEVGEQQFYARTESLFYEVFDNELTFKAWNTAKKQFAATVVAQCQALFKELTDPYAHKPELIPIIAAARHSLQRKLTENLP